MRLRSLATASSCLFLALASHALVARAATVCPGPNAVYGIDVSEFQGSINWGQVKAAGKAFAIIRVSDGSGYLDKTFATNWPAAKSAGVIRGVYQFFEPGEDPVAQANLLLSRATGMDANDLPPMIDVEVTGGQSPATINANIHKWVDTIQAATGKKPLIYTGGWFWNPDVASGDFVSYPLVDSYYCSNCCPNIATPWTSWTMWQYSSTGSVAGISGNVDLDQFNGTLADLQALTGGGADWGAKYVSQTWPFATTEMQMVVNQRVAANITMKNVGQKSWSANTKLATTQPHDRASVFAAPDWLSPSRPASCPGGAAPGADCAFQFTFQAPNTPGDYKEFFGFVEEGVHWFSDPGQGGPADDVVEAWIDVAEADYHGEFVAQSYPLAPAAQAMKVGETVDGWIDLKNVGNQTWKAGETMLAPTPRDMADDFAAADWVSATRVSTIAADVAPGATGRFPLSLTAKKVGDVKLTFGLVENGVTWFADAPKGGGPPDDLLAVHVVVTESADMAAGGGSSGDGGSHGHPSDGQVDGEGDGGAAMGVALASGCAVGGRGAATSGAGGALLAIVSAALFGRRRTRRAS